MNKFLNIFFGQCSVNIKPICWVKNNSFDLKIEKETTLGKPITNQHSTALPLNEKI